MKGLAVFLRVVVLLGLLAGCAPAPAPTSVPTQTPRPQPPTPTETPDQVAEDVIRGLSAELDPGLLAYLEEQVEPPEPFEPLVVEFWTATHWENLDGLAARFEEMYPGVEIRVTYLDSGDMRDHVAAALEGAELPADVLELDLGLAHRLVAEGWLDTVAASEVISELGEESFFAGVLDLVRSPMGDRWGSVPLSAWLNGLWYRTDLFEASGLLPPRTWDGILTAAQMFQDQGMVGFAPVMSPGSTGTQYAFEHLALSNGARPLDAQGEVAFDDEPMVEALDFWSGLAPYLPDPSQDVRSLFATGQAPMTMYHSAIMADIPDLVDRVGLVAIIEGPQGLSASCGGLSTLGILDGPNAPAAQVWIEFLLGEAYADLLQGTAFLPVRKDAWGPRQEEEPFAWYSDGVLEEIEAGLENVQRWDTQGGLPEPALVEMAESRLVSSVLVEMVRDRRAPKPPEWSISELTKGAQEILARIASAYRRLEAQRKRVEKIKGLLMKSAEGKKLLDQAGKSSDIWLAVPGGKIPRGIVGRAIPAADGKRVTIYLNQTVSDAQLAVTLAHELHHAVRAFERARVKESIEKAEGKVGWLVGHIYAWYKVYVMTRNGKALWIGTQMEEERTAFEKEFQVLKELQAAGVDMGKVNAKWRDEAGNLLEKDALWVTIYELYRTQFHTQYGRHKTTMVQAWKRLGKVLGKILWDQGLLKYMETQEQIMKVWSKWQRQLLLEP